MKIILHLTHWRCAVFCTCPQSVCQPRIHSIRGTSHKAECRLCSQSRCGIDCSRRTRSSSKLSALHFLLKNNIENCSLFESRAGLNRIRKLVIYTTEERECFSGKTRHFASFSNDNSDICKFDRLVFSCKTLTVCNNAESGDELRRSNGQRRKAALVWSLATNCSDFEEWIGGKLKILLTSA